MNDGNPILAKDALKDEALLSYLVKNKCGVIQEVSPADAEGKKKAEAAAKKAAETAAAKKAAEEAAAKKKAEDEAKKAAENQKGKEE